MCNVSLECEFDLEEVAFETLCMWPCLAPSLDS
jgi:hypothetical protein